MSRHASAEAVTPDRDQKLAELKALIAEKAHRPTKNKLGNLNRKVLVFTAFAGTANYLYDHLHEWALKELGIQSALVLGTGENRTTFQPPGFQRHTDYNHILTNFSPTSKRRAKITSMAMAPRRCGRWVTDQPMNRSRAATFQAAAPKIITASSRP